MSDPGEVGQLALRLCSPLTHNITGVSIPVDGGWTARESILAFVSGDEFEGALLTCVVWFNIECNLQLIIVNHFVDHRIKCAFRRIEILGVSAGVFFAGLARKPFYINSVYQNNISLLRYQFPVCRHPRTVEKTPDFR